MALQVLDLEGSAKSIRDSNDYSGHKFRGHHRTAFSCLTHRHQSRLLELDWSMYLRRQVKQPILLRLFVGRSCDWARASSMARGVEKLSSILIVTK